MTTIQTVLVRKSTKQAWSQVKETIELKDMKLESLAAWIAGANSILGWNKYKAPEVEEAAHLAYIDGADDAQEAVDHYEELLA